jgi:hypothetical protein
MRADSSADLPSDGRKSNAKITLFNAKNNAKITRDIARIACQKIDPAARKGFILRAFASVQAAVSLTQINAAALI